MNAWPAAPELLTRLFETVTTVSWQASLLILIVLALGWLVRDRLGVGFQYALGLLILARLALPTGLEVSWRPIAWSAPWHPTEPVLIVEANDVPFELTHYQPAQPIHAESPAAIPPATSQIDMPSLAAWVWLAGMLVCIGIPICRHTHFALRLRRQPSRCPLRVREMLEDCRERLGIRHQVRLLLIPGLGGPALFGWLKPTILLPADLVPSLSDTGLRMILLHELVHVRRHDALLNWLMISARAVHWFNPLVWFAMRRLRADRELLCDEGVLAQLDPNEHRAYGETLLALATRISTMAQAPGLAVVGRNQPQTKRRILMITRYKPRTRLGIAVTAAALSGLFLLTFTQAATDPPKPESPPSHSDVPRSSANPHPGEPVRAEAPPHADQQVSPDLQRWLERMRVPEPVAERIIAADKERLQSLLSLDLPEDQMRKLLEQERRSLEKIIGAYSAATQQRKVLPQTDAFSAAPSAPYQEAQQRELKKARDLQTSAQAKAEAALRALQAHQSGLRAKENSLREKESKLRDIQGSFEAQLKEIEKACREMALEQRALESKLEQMVKAHRTLEREQFKGDQASSRDPSQPKPEHRDEPRGLQTY